MSTAVAISNASHLEVLAQHGRSFHLASHFLPRFARKDAALLYAFCRYVDDIADESPDARQATEGLQAIRSDLHARRPKGALVKALVQRSRVTRLDLEAADQLVEGVASDLEGVRMSDDRALIRYCYRVAGTVGIMMCAVLRVRDSKAIHFAIDLGVGMQLTNICRDVLEDASMGRVYLPSSRLNAAGTSAKDLLNGQADPEAVTAVVTDLLALADRYYASADQGMRAIPMPARAAILVASRVYRAIGHRLMSVHRGNPLHGRTVVPMWSRMLWLMRGLAQLVKPTFWNAELPQHEAFLHRHLAGLPRVDHDPQSVNENE
jgi:phytoene synthase